MKKKFLILGGTGFLGSHLTKILVKRDSNKITCTFNLKKKFKKIKKVKYIKCDISNKKNIKNLGSNYDYVINFAGYVDHKKKDKTINSHYLGCKNLADFFSNKKIKLFIQIGSSLEYGKKNSPHKETIVNNITEMKSFYSRSKLMATKYLKKLSDKNLLNVCVVRPYLVYGPGQDYNRIIPIVMKSAIKNLCFDCSDGKQKRDFLYISDFIGLMIKIINKKNIKFEIFNAGSGKPISIKYIIKKIIFLVGKGKPNFGAIKSRIDEALETYASVIKTRKKLNWYPKVNFDEGLKKTYKFYKNDIRKS